MLLAVAVKLIAEAHLCITEWSMAPGKYQSIHPSIQPFILCVCCVHMCEINVCMLGCLFQTEGERKSFQQMLSVSSVHYMLSNFTTA